MIPVLANLARFLPHLIAVAALGGLVWGYGHSRYNAGYNTAEARMQRLVAAANARADKAEADQRLISEVTGREIETLRSQRDKESSRARSNLRPVLLCEPAPGRGEVPATAGPTPATDGASGAAELPLPARRDIGPALVMLAESCQRDHDDAMKWREWWAKQATQRAE